MKDLEQDAGPDPTEAAPSPAPARRRKPTRRAVWLSLRGLLLICAIPVFIVLLVPVLLIGQEVTAPSWIKAQVEEQAAQVLGGGALTFGDITVTIARNLHPTIRVRQAVLQDAEDNVLVRVPQIEALVSPRGILLQQEVLPQVLTLSGAELALRRGSDGTLALAFETRGDGRAGVQSLAEVLGALDLALEQPSLAALEEVRVTGLILNYDDARAGRSWVVDGGEMVLQTVDETIRLGAELSLLSGRDYVTSVSVEYQSPRGEAGADLALTITDAPARDIASQSPALSWLSVLRARVSAQLRASIDEEGQLGPMFATVDIADGALQPDPGARPIAFTDAKAYLQFDPAAQLIRFEQIELESDWGDLRAEGQAYLRDIEDGLPSTLLAQFRAIEVSMNPAGLFPEALNLHEVSADMRLGLRPFRAEIGYFGMTARHADGQTRIEGQARADITDAGWDVSGSARIPRLSQPDLLALWPPDMAPRSRRWFEINMLGGELVNLAAGIRARPGAPLDWALTHGFEAASLRVLRQWPPLEGAAGVVTIQDRAMTVMVEAGAITPPAGGAVDMSGSVLQVPRIGIPEAPAEITTRASGPIAAVLSLLDLPPLGLLSRADLPADLARGQATISGQINLPLMRNVPRERIDYAFDARLRDVISTALVPDRRLSSSDLALVVTEDGVSLTGPMRLGAATADVEWRQTLGTPGSIVRAQVALNDAFWEEFNISLPPGMVSGAGSGDLSLRLRRDQPPEFDITSDLRGLTLRLPTLGWSKPGGTAGRIALNGSLGETPQIDRISLQAAGLTAEGRISLRPGGGLDRAQFSTVRLGGWLDAAVALVGRGAGRPVGVELSGGTLDLRQANFGTGSGGGQSGPMEIALDRLQITDGMFFDRFRASFDGGTGLNGRFTARLGGTAPVEGVLAPVDGRTGLRLVSQDAGAVLAAAGLLDTASGGALNLTLSPTGGAGTYDGVLAVTDLRVREAPALASLLDAISVVGLLQQLDGQGLRFTNVDAQFRLTPAQIILTQSSAVGPGLGISVDGVYTLAGKVMDFQGVVSPVYLINGIGSVLTRPGEGLFGFNFTLRGPADQAQVGVNPLSVLTPGMFREIFRRPPPEVE